MPHACLVREPIEPARVLALVGDAGHGAAVLFLGVVRNEADGRAVSGIAYDAYEEMAAAVLAAIADEACERWGTDRMAVFHRVGELSVGDVSVAIAVSSCHRAEAFEASRYVIEEIKHRLPVWKKERYAGGDEAWVVGSVPPSRSGEGA